MISFCYKDTRRILSIACRNGLYDVAKLMIEKGANVNTPDWVSYNYQ